MEHRKEKKMKKKIKDSVVLFAEIERKQHEALRELAFKTHRSIADVTREAIKNYTTSHKKSSMLKYQVNSHSLIITIK